MSKTGRGGTSTRLPDPTGDLAGLGVGPTEERLYRTLLRHGPATVGRLAELAGGLTEAQVRRQVPRLVDLGLVSRLPGRPVRLVPGPPEAAIEALAARRLEELNRSRATTPLLVEEALFGAHSRPEDLLELVTGQEAVARRFVHLYETAQDEVLFLVLPPYALGPTDPDHPQQAGPTRPGLRVQSIYDPSALETPEVLAFVALCMEHGEEARIGEVPLKLVIADRRSAMLPLTSGGVVESSLVIHASALLDALVSLFDVLWRAAVPFPVAGDRAGDENAARETQVVALLMAGVTDEAIARQLGVSSRTVQRDVRKICADLGAVTRFQAGLKLSRSRSRRDRTDGVSDS